MTRYKSKEEQRAEKYAKVSQLSEDMAKWIVRNEEEWKKYLTTAARIYKYPFHEQLLIYAQRPDATAVASVKIWNERMFCWVNKGSKGIALLDKDYPGENRLKYVFDVSDVHKAKRIGRDPNLWTMKEEYKDAVIARLEQTYGKTDSNLSFEKRLMELAESIAEDCCEDVAAELMYAREGTYLAELDEQNLKLRVRETLCSSVAYTLLCRCGAGTESFKDDMDFSYIHEFNSQQALSVMGTAVSDMAKPVLMEIGREIRAIEKKQQRQTNIRKSIANEYDLDYNALKRESNDALEHEKQRERGNENEHNLHTERGLSDSGHSSRRGSTRDGNTIWRDENEIPSGTQARDLSSFPIAGYVKITPPYNPGAGRGENGRTDETDGKGTERDRGTQSHRPDEMGKRNEQHQTGGRGNRTERTDLRINKSESSEQYRQLSLFPSETEQITNIKATEAGMKQDRPVAFSLDEKQIKDIILTGGGREDCRKRIFYQYQHGKSPKEMADFLRKEYGKVGKGFMLDGHPISVWFDENGMTAGDGNSAKKNALLTMDWDEIENVTRNMVEHGEYMSVTEAFLVDEKVHTKVANHIYFFLRDGVGKLPESLELEGFDYPKGEARLKELLASTEGATKLLSELEKLNEELKNGQLELRYRMSRSIDELIEDVKACLSPVRELKTADSISLLQEDFFTQEEIDEILKSGSSIQHGKFRIYEQLIAGHSTEDNIAFLKHEYGVGGKAPAIIGTDHSSEEHDAKGIRLSKGSIINPYLKITIKWNLVEKRLRELVAEDKYMTPKQKEEYQQYKEKQYWEQQPQDVVVDTEEKLESEETPKSDLSTDYPQGFTHTYPQDDVEIVQKGDEKNVDNLPKMNYVIKNDGLGCGTEKEKCILNVDAIRTLKKIEQEERFATPEEQEILSKYVGWGGLAEVFDENKMKWSNEYQELKQLLSEEEYTLARESTLNAHYTSPVIIRSIYDTLEKMGFEKGNILEPSMGIGNFFGMLPEKMQDSRLFGVELDSITGRIAKQLYQKADIQISGFEKTNYPNDFFDIAVGNVPFGQYKVKDKDYDKNNFLIHDYFMAKALDKVRPGGVIAFVTSKGTMDKKSEEVRKYLAQRAELLGAVRLPNTAFKENAGTEVTSDILF